ncbi:MAG: WD40 repeat domain-containing protein, partial [Dolichospermum sp.]
WVNEIAITPYGETLFSAYEDTIKAWDLGTGTEKFTLSGHSDYWVSVLAVTRNGQMLIAIYADDKIKEIKAWDLETKTEIVAFTGKSPILTCAVASDGLTIVAGETSGTLRLLRLQERGWWSH